jgi:hypothetical protein
MEIIMTAEDAPLDRPIIKIDAEGRDHTGVADIIPSLSLGVSEETVQRWKDEGKIHATTLPAGSLRRVTSEDTDRLAAEGKLYGPFPRSVAEAALKAAQAENPEPPAAA